MSVNVIYAGKQYKGTATDKGILVCSLNRILPYPTTPVKPIKPGRQGRLGWSTRSRPVIVPQ